MVQARRQPVRSDAVTVLPIVQRELRVAARRPATFQVRFVSALIVVLISGLFLAATELPGRLQPSGSTLFSVAAYFELALALLSGPLLTADCLSRERREGTLGFLFLTDLTGLDVVGGKLAALALIPLHGLLAMFPVTAITFCLGGVDGPEVLRVSLVLINTLLLSLSLGLGISAHRSDDRQAIGLTILILAALTLLPELAARLVTLLPDQAGGFPFGTPGSAFSLATISPAGLLSSALSINYPIAPTAFWCALGGQHLLAWSLIVGTSIGLHRSLTRPESPRHPANDVDARPRRSRLARPWLRRRLRAQGPLAWHAWQATWIRRGAWWTAGLVSALAVATFLALALGGRPMQAGPTASAVSSGGFHLLKILLAVHAVYFLHDACRTGAMEILLVTPVTGRQLADSHLTAMRTLVTGPFLLLSITHLGIGIASRPVAGGDWPNLTTMIMAGTLPAVFTIVVQAFDLVAIAYHASRLALKYDRPIKALARTLIGVGLLPAVICGQGRLLVDLIVIGQSRPALNRFRELARGWFFPGPAAAHFGPPRFG